MENMSPGTLASSRETSVDLPDPDGAEMMNTVVMERTHRGDTEGTENSRSNLKAFSVTFRFPFFVLISFLRVVSAFSASPR
jgi:hypothetical protein